MTGLGHRDRRAATERLLAVYGPLIPPETFRYLKSALRAGEAGLAVEDLAFSLLTRRIPLREGDAVDFRRLLRGFTLSPDTPPDIADRLMFGQDPPTDHLIHLHPPVAPAAVAAATAAEFAIPPTRIEVLIDGEPAPTTPDRPAVLITADPSTGAVTFNAADEFCALTDGASELAVAKALCRRLDCHATLGPHGLTPNQWLLITATGGHGIVMADADAGSEGHWKILYTYEPINGAPTLPLGPPAPHPTKAARHNNAPEPKKPPSLD